MLGSPGKLLGRAVMLTGVAMVLGAAGGGCASSAAGPPPTGVFYVAVHGDDRGPGSAARPWATLQHAVDAAPPGARVWVRPGRYRGFTMTRSGRRGRPTELQATPRSRPSVEPTSAEDVVRLQRVHDVRVTGLVVAGARGKWHAGVRVESSRRVTLDRLVLSHNTSFGAAVEDSSEVRLTGSSIYGNETGVQISRGGRAVIARNSIHDNDRLIVNDAAPLNDRGANALVFFRTKGPILVESNRIWANRGTSHDFGHDGGAFEVYDSSRLTIRRNVVFDNQNVMETGTSPGGSCEDNKFYENVAYGAATTGPAMGLILRCARSMLVAFNSFYGLDAFVYDITARARAFGGAIDGLTIADNVAVSRGQRVYSIDSALPRSVRVDRNLAWDATGRRLAYLAGTGNTPSLAQFTQWTGLERHGVQADPRFRHPGRGDLRLRPGSPAIDRGRRIGGLRRKSSGRAPDLGRYEAG